MSNVETQRIQSAPRLRGRLEVPPDKSLTHRAILFAALAEGESRLRRVLKSEDCMHTLGAVEAMGVGSRWTDAGELLPRIARDRDFHICQMCPWSNRCWSLEQ